MMIGYGGTGKSDKQYHYYMCKKARKKKCDKKIIGKQYIEDRVVSECLKMLTDDKIRYIAKRVAEECNKSPDNISVREIKKAIKEVDAAIENLWKGIEQGQSVDMLTERLHKRQAEKEELETQLAIENNKKICLSQARHPIKFCVNNNPSSNNKTADCGVIRLSDLPCVNFSFLPVECYARFA